MHRAGLGLAGLLLLLCGCRASLPNPASPEGSDRVLIRGVPFISWAEAARLPYQDKSILNPSFAASLGMVLRYWGQDLSLLERSKSALPREPGGWGRVKGGEAKSFDELKPWLARGIPILVSPAMTPVAHIPGPHVFGLAAIDPAVRRLIGEERGVRSGVLGRMLALDTFRRLHEEGRHPWESLFVSSRVVIGYDDGKGIVILHDPSFGPGWEVRSDDFDTMWAAHERAYILAYPPDYAAILAARPPAPPYPSRTPDQQAAWQYVLGYALSSVGRVPEGEIQLKKGLAIRGVGNAYQHLLRLELALHAGTRGNMEDSTAMLRRAIDLLPQHHRPWQFIAQNARNGFVPDAERKAAEADQKAAALCSDPEAQKTVARMLARDFFIVGCRGLVGPPG